METLLEIYIEICTPPIAVEAVEMLFWQGENEVFILSHPLYALPCVFRCFTEIDLSVSLMIFEEKLHTLEKGSNCFARWSAASLLSWLSMHVDASQLYLKYWLRNFSFTCRSRGEAHIIHSSAFRGRETHSRHPWHQNITQISFLYTENEMMFSSLLTNFCVCRGWKRGEGVSREKVSRRNSLIKESIMAWNWLFHRWK